jgi:hypothetical protein
LVTGVGTAVTVPLAGSFVGGSVGSLVGLSVFVGLAVGSFVGGDVGSFDGAGPAGVATTVVGVCSARISLGASELRLWTSSLPTLSTAAETEPTFAADVMEIALAREIR